MKKVLSTMLLLVVFITACSTPQSTPTPAAPAMNVPAVVSASGKVLPNRWANVSFQTGGQLIAVKVQAGDSIKAGDVIAQLDDTDARLAVSQAEAALAIAQAQLAQIKAGSRTEQVAAAEQAVKAADANVLSASAQLAQLQAGARPAEIAAAEADVAKAASDVTFAQQLTMALLKVALRLKNMASPAAGWVSTKRRCAPSCKPFAPRMMWPRSVWRR